MSAFTGIYLKYNQTLYINLALYITATLSLNDRIIKWKFLSTNLWQLSIICNAITSYIL